MSEDELIKCAVKRCIECGMPFAYFKLPGEELGHFFASSRTRTSAEGDCFMIRLFGINHISAPLEIHADYDARTVMRLAEKGMSSNKSQPKVRLRGVSKPQYLKQAASIISQLRITHGKTVLSRVIVRKVDSSRLFDVVDEYLGKFPDTFRFVYYTEETGLWFGASPELLLDYNGTTKQLMTMSLAGTRPVGDAKTPWDAKNVAEHQFVTDYLIDGLRRHGMMPEIYDSAALRFGQIEHLCDRIRAVGDIDPCSLADTLAPTPALCGIPREEAYRQIVETEAHHRYCYGGWLGLRLGGRFKAYVNLRSAMVEANGLESTINIYVGGGLTEDSDPEAEWQETERKAAPMLESI